MVPENMTSQIKLCLVLKPHQPHLLINNVSQNFLSNEHLTCQHYNKTYKIEDGLNRHKPKCKERDNLSDNNEHNIPSTSNDSDITASRTIEHPWSQTGKHKVIYTMRTIPDICQHLQKLDQYVEKIFIPALKE